MACFHCGKSECGLVQICCDCDYRHRKKHFDFVLGLKMWLEEKQKEYDEVADDLNTFPVNMRVEYAARSGEIGEFLEKIEELDKEFDK